jgi:ribosomal protein S6
VSLEFPLAEPKGMKLYELAYLLKPALSQEELKRFQEKLITLFESKGGILDSQTQAGKRALAYPIKIHGNTYTSAYFGAIRFFAPQESIPEILQTIQSEREIIRFLLLQEKRKESVTKTPQLARKRQFVPSLKSKTPKVELGKLEEKLEELLKS